MDWQSLIKELQAAGYTQVKLGAECGCAQTTISDLARGVTKTPGFTVGMKLMELAQKARADAAEKQQAPASKDDTTQAAA